MIRLVYTFIFEFMKKNTSAPNAMDEHLVQRVTTSDRNSRPLSKTFSLAEGGDDLVEKTKTNLMDWLFKGTTPPKSGFEDVTKLYVSCARKRNRFGRNKWNEEELAFLKEIQNICILSNKSPPHVGAMMLIEEGIQSLLRALYIIIVK